MSIRRLLGTLLALLLLAGPASAATSNQVGLSWDGTTWSSQLAGTLFNRPGSIRAWVPGDSDSERFLVRNRGGDAARLAIDYSLPPNSLMGEDFTVTASVDGGAPITLTPATGWIPLSGAALANGRHAEVAVTATFASSSTNQSQTDRFSLAFRVRLTELPGPGTDTAGPTGETGQGSPDGDGDSDDAHGAGALPGTGAPEVGWPLGLGLLSLGGGIAIVVLSRRRRRDGEAS